MIQETSRMAYHQIEDELGERQTQVLEEIKTHDKICNLEIAVNLGLPINSITPRVKELRQKGLVDEWGRDICPYTNRMVIYWTAKRGQQRLLV